MRGVFLLAVLIAAGLAGNHFAFPIFFNAEFIFGSIFSLLVLQLFGLGPGTLAALVISSVLYFNWGHHYALPIMGAEVVVVGWLNSRYRLGFIQADALYWIGIGMPLVYLCYHLAMKVPPDRAEFIMVKDMVNGVANMALARLLFMGFTLRSRLTPIPYREAIYTALAFFVLAPTLTLLAVSGRAQFKETDDLIRVTLLQNNARITKRIQTWVVNRKSAVFNLAAMAATAPPQQIQPFLEQATKADINFLRIGMLNENAVTTAYYPLVDEQGRSNLGIDFADRPYVPRLKETLRPMLSEVVTARIGSPKHVVIMLAPVIRRGQYGGYIAGVLSLDQIRDHLEASVTGTSSLYTLLDRDGRIIMTNHTDQKVAAPLDRGRGHMTPLQAGISQWIPTLAPNTAAIERWGKSFYLAESAIGDLAEWKLVLEQPVADFQKALFDRYSKNLALLLLLLILSLGIAELVSRLMTHSMEELGELTQDLPLKLASGDQEIQWPESGIHESNRLISSFRIMAGSLSEQFRNVRQAKDLLEQRVLERTRELRESEEKFRTVADFTYDWEAWEGPEGEWLYCSPSCERITGHKPEAFKEDPGLLQRMIHPDDLPKWKAHHAKVHPLAELRKSSRNQAEDLDVRILRSDGETRWIGHTCHAIYDASGQFRGRRISNRDITDRKHLEAQLLQSQKLESLGILAGGVAHEMNNVLAAILGLASLHQELQPEGSTLQRAFTTITDACTRGRDVVRSLLVFARHDLAEEKPLNLNVLVQEDMLLLGRTTMAQVRIELDLAPDLQPIRGDASALNHALMNLCLNAVDAMPANGTLTVRTRNVDAEWIELQVEDTGCGMPKEILDRAMDPFFTTKDPGKGTGLGLSVAHTTVMAHHGHMELQSEPGRGTRVLLRFPACQDALAASAIRPALAAAVAPASLKVLLVDDDELIQSSMQGLLEILGHATVTALSGEEALAKLRDGFQPDVVILDMNMPGLSGAETLPGIRTLLPAVPVLLATGRADQSALALVEAHSLVTLLPKPFGVQELRAGLQAVGLA
ncbi:MAG TPA: ATP-binding protein [Geothrix sp.]|nr:ATP-binding protein [Geothrix sp.]